ncbi:MAG: FtsW/RodA/SpoVE family cell cycle protein [bacterium]|nr:FtsW/RodA/SpoVE family cell cycle protein [bacterium]
MYSRVDLFLFLPAVLLAILGSFTLSSVSPASYPGHFIFLGLALLSFLAFAFLDLRILKTLAPSFYIISCILLVATLIFGGLTRGSVRWIDLGPLSFQPSEIVKPLLIIFFAWIVARSRQETRFLIAIGALLLPFLLVLVQPDLGSAIVIIAGGLGVMFLGGIPVRFVAVLAILGIIIAPWAWTGLASYQKDRLSSYLSSEADPLGSGYNSIQSQIAVGSGEMFGRGIGQGTQAQLLFLPERHTDFIFASIAEELGFLGSSLIILAFAIILVRIVLIARSARDIFEKSILGGAFAVFFIQSGVNIGMNLGVLPITGIPLPFVSSGGSSLLAMSILLGIASAVSAEQKNLHFKFDI